ncbi:hypothetical protein ACOMHN_036420 [Nucella lapillus]
MTDILCRWLNDELALSHSVDPATFARDFSSGYLIGEVLHKYQLQKDFEQFSQSRTMESQLNNFSRMEPVFRQLGLPLDTTLARDVMTEKHGMAARLLYQLYIVINNRRRSSLPSRPLDPNLWVKFNTIEDNRLIEQARKQRAHQQREATLPDIQREQTEGTFSNRFLESEKRLREREQHQLDMLERSRLLQAKQSEMVAKIRSSTLHVPRPPSKSNKFVQERQALRRKREASDTVAAISRFEDKLKMILLPTDDGSDEIDISYILKRDEDRTDTLNIIKLSSNSEYIGKIRKRLQEDAVAREEREKCRRKVVGEQTSAHQAQEEARREEVMVNKLLRQSQQERRVAVQLLQARREKAAVRMNRIAHQQQFQQRRLKEFDEALNREAVLVEQEQEENKEQLQQAQEQHDTIAAQHAQDWHRRHYHSCRDIVAQVVDFSCRVAEYRQLTENLIPAKLMRDWTAMFVSGHPLYQSAPLDTGEPTPEQILEEERQMLLDEGDFMEFKNMIGEWQPPEWTEVSGPPRSNPVVGHIIQRLYSIVHPPTPPPPPPEFPPFPLRACVVGKPFSGKTTVVRKLLEDHRLVVLDVEELVAEAVEAHRNNELTEVTHDQLPRETSASDRPSQDKDSHGEAGATTTAEGGGGAVAEASPSDKGQAVSAKASAGQVKPQEARDGALPPKPSSVQRARDKHKDPNEPQPTLRSRLGSKALKFLKKGRPVDDQITVDILVDAIKRVPEGTGWVIDGYPQNYNQAKILEKALSGYNASAKENVKQVMKSKSRKSSLIPDPHPTPPPSEPTSGIDVVILFRIDDDVCIKRASEQPKVGRQQEPCGEESNLPEEGSASAAGRAEKAGSVSDPPGDQDHLQQKGQEKAGSVSHPAEDQHQLLHKLTWFQDGWPKLDKWFTRFGTLQRVDAADVPHALFLEVEHIMERAVAKILGKDLESSLPLEPTEGVAEKAEEAPEAAPGEAGPEVPKEASGTAVDAKVSVTGSRSGSRAGSAKRPASHASSKEGHKDPGHKDPGPEKAAATKRTGSGRKSDTSSTKSQRDRKRGSVGMQETGITLEPADAEPEVPAGPQTPQPGDEEWEFVDRQLDPALADVLSHHWEGVETTYVANCKHIFRQARQERENIYRYFFQVRKDFLNYLRRPDCKQSLVEQWQRDFNAVPSYRREDEQTRAELQQRVDDLRERLWSVCDQRKDQAERQRTAVMTDGWLDHRLGVLTNQYIAIMQAELDRFQDTVRLLRDYYRGMGGQLPEELCTNYPLMELSTEKVDPLNTGEQEMAPVVSPSPESLERQGSQSPPEQADKAPREDDGVMSPVDKEEPGKEGEREGAAPLLIPVVRIKIPLVPHQGEFLEPLVAQGPAPTDQAEGWEGQKQGQDVTGEGEATLPEGPKVPSAPPQDPDEKFLYDAHLFAVLAVADIMSEEMAARDAEEEAEKPVEQSPKHKTSTGKALSVDLSEENGLKKDARAKMEYEHDFTIKEEEAGAVTRMALVRAISVAVVRDLKQKADNAFKDTDDWLGARFLKEMESIDTMSEVMRHAIEDGLPLKERIVLEQDDFLMDSDLDIPKLPSPPPPPLSLSLSVKIHQFFCVESLDLDMLKTPSPLPFPLPESLEETMPDHFTVNQLFTLFKQVSVVGWGAVWCGVGWCGAERCGVVWCGVIWSLEETMPDHFTVNQLFTLFKQVSVVGWGAVWCGVGWCGAERCGVVWCGVIWSLEETMPDHFTVNQLFTLFKQVSVVGWGAVWCGGVGWCGAERCGVVWCGVIWSLEETMPDHFTVNQLFTLFKQVSVVGWGAVWCGGVGWCGAERCGVVWCGVIWSLEETMPDHFTVNQLFTLFKQVSVVGWGAVWCGRVGWCGAERCGVVWCGVIWSLEETMPDHFTVNQLFTLFKQVSVVGWGAVWCGGVGWCGAERCGVVWCGVIWSLEETMPDHFTVNQLFTLFKQVSVVGWGAVWCGGVGWCGAERCGVVWCGVIWSLEETMPDHFTVNQLFTLFKQETMPDHFTVNQLFTLFKQVSVVGWGAVWCGGVGWCGAERCGVVWCGVIWSLEETMPDHFTVNQLFTLFKQVSVVGWGAVWCGGVGWCGAERCGVVWCGVIWSLEETMPDHFTVNQLFTLFKQETMPDHFTVNQLFTLFKQVSVVGWGGVRCGVVGWCGAVRSGVVWCGVIWSLEETMPDHFTVNQLFTLFKQVSVVGWGGVRCGVVGWGGAVRSGVVWCGVIWSLEETMPDHFTVNQLFTLFKQETMPDHFTVNQLFTLFKQETMPDHFTVNQLFTLFKQLREVAPTGAMSASSFREMLENVVSAASGTNHLPDLWANMTHAQLLLSLLWPLPTPSQGQLLDTLQRFRDSDQRSIGFISREQFDRTDMWFDTMSPYHDSFDRLTSVKKIVFDIFADHSGSLSKLDYRHMLLYFSAAPNPYEGFLRALSVMTGCHMPRIPKPVTSSTSTEVSSDHFDHSSKSLTNGPPDSLTVSTDIPVTSLESIKEGKEEKPEPPEPAMMGDKIPLEAEDNVVPLDDLYEIPLEAVDNVVPLDDLYEVLQFGEQCEGESHRFNVSDPVEKTPKEKLTAIYTELGEGAVVPLTLRGLLKHPNIQQTVLACRTFTALNVDQILACSANESATA